MAEPGRGGRIDRAVAALVGLAAARPRAVLAVLAVALVLATFGIARLGVDTDSSAMLARDLPFQQRARALNAAFPSLKNAAVVVVRGADQVAVDAVTERLADRLGGRLSGVFAPSADPFLRRHGLLYQDRAAVSAQIGRLAQGAELIASLRADPTLAGFLATLAQAARLAPPGTLAPIYAEAAGVIAANGARPFDWAAAFGAAPGPALRVITVTPTLDYTGLNPARAAMDAVAAEIAALEPALTLGVEIGLTGDPVLRAEELAQVRVGLGLGQALSLALVAGLVWLCLRSAARTALALAALAVSLVLTAGLAGWGLGSLNLISVAFVVIMIGMGIEYALHFLAHVGPHPDARALRGVGGRIGGALVLSAATTAVAFLAFTTTDFVGMAQLGLIGGVGVLVACAVALTLIPAVLACRPGGAPPPAAPAPPGATAPATPGATAPATLGAQTLASSGALAPAPPGALAPPPPGPWARRWAAAALALGAAAALIAPAARFDADPMGLRDADAPAVRAYGWLAVDPRTQPLRLSLMVPDAAAARAAAERLRALPQVAQALWLGDLVPGDQEHKLALLDLAYPSLMYAVEGVPLDLGPRDPAALAPLLAADPGPEAAALAAALARPHDPGVVGAALFARFPALLARIADLGQAGPVTAADLPPPLRVRFQAPDGTLRVEIAPTGDMADPAALAAFVTAARAVAPAVAGPPDQILGAAGAVGGAMGQAAGLILAASVALCYAVTRRARAVVAILAPLGLAALVTMAFSVVAGVPFNFANIIVLPLMIGIGIDGGVHLALRRPGQGAATPRAILFAALASIAAFGSLALSPHPGTASMGLMLTVAVTAAMAMIFALTPAILGRPGDGGDGPLRVTPRTGS